MREGAKESVCVRKRDARERVENIYTEREGVCVCVCVRRTSPRVREREIERERRTEQRFNERGKKKTVTNRETEREKR